MRMLHFAVLLAGLAALTVVPSQAQLQDSVSRIGAALARLQPESRIRVHTEQGWVDGRVESSSSRLVLLRVGQTLTEVPGGRVDSVLVHHSGAGKGALIGALVLGVPTAILAGLLAANPLEGPPGNTGDAIGAGLVGLVVGAVPGALVGGLIGSTSHHWSLVVP